MRQAVLLFLVFQSAPGSAYVPPPPAPPVAGPIPARQALVTWTPGEVRCAGSSLAGATIRRPYNSLAWSGVQSQLQPVTLLFAIGATGRAGSIHFETPALSFANADLGPALAASQFPAAAQASCTITYTPRLEPLSSAQFEDLVSYSMTPLSGPLPSEAWARIKGGADCFRTPRPQPLARAFPDFRKVPATPGVKDWAMVGFGTNASGKPVKVHQLSSTGNAALEAGAAKAVRDSRFASGARSGCLYPYWRRAGRLPAPPLPAEDAFRSAGASCGDDRRWAMPLNLRFPPAYERRNIEGWAVVSYDIAPWGALGNIKVLRAEPSEAFGSQAVQVLQSARVVPSAQGSTGCVDRVKFVMPPDAEATATPDTNSTAY